jgi:tetratricopeptide (TPR) repeat protein
VTNFAPDAVDTLTQPLHYTYDYERNPYGDWASHQIVSLLPYSLFGGNTLTKEPDDPIDVGAPRMESAKSSITLPPGWTVPTLPNDVHAKSSFATFDLTYSLHGAVLTTEARMQVTAFKLPAKQWEEYNAFLKDISDSEVFITLAQGSESSSKAAASGSVAPKPTQLDAAAQGLMTGALEAFQNHDMGTAQNELKAAQAENPNGRGVWFLSGSIAGMQRQWTEAETDLKKEMALYPDEKDKILPTLLWIQRAENHAADEIVTLDALRAAYPDNLQYVQAEGQLMSDAGRAEDGLALLEAAALRHPHDKPTLFALATVQFTAGRPEEAKVPLEYALEDATDPETLNNGAYLLANHDIDLPLAYQDTVAALAALDTETQKTKLNSLTANDLAAQFLLSATWDTMGWIDFEKGDLAAAEDMMHAAYSARQSPEVGYHLGMVYEKEGKPQDALRCYTLASSGLSKPPKDVAAELKLRMDALAAKGVHVDLQQPADTLLAKQRMLDLPLLVNTSGSAEYFLLASGGKVTAIQAVAGDDALRGFGPQLQKAIDTNHTLLQWPKGSTASLLRRGVLSCSSLTHSCQFVLYRLQDTQLPGKALSITVTPAPPHKQ